MPEPTPPDLASRLERLITGSTELAGQLSLSGVLQQVADLAAEVIGARFAAIGMLGPDHATLESFTTSGLPLEARARIGLPPRGLGILGVVTREGRPLRLADLAKHPDSFGFPPHHPPMKSFLGVPVPGRRGILGSLYLTEKIGGGEFSDEDEYIATLLAARAGAAVEQARLLEETSRLLEEVQQLHRSRERFFAMVNHELRNSLAAVFGWAEMLVRRKDPKTVPRAAFEVLDSAEQAIGLINDLLDLSRLDEDRLRPVKKQVECHALIRQALSRVTPAAETKHVTLEPDLDSEPFTCHTDPHRVEQILLNLLVNAIRHTPEGSKVEITACRDGDRALVHIMDEGPGVSEEEVEQIFDVYVTKAGDERKGSGLGLPLSRRLARLLGGEVLAIPRGDGGGGHFILELPLVGRS